MSQQSLYDFTADDLSGHHVDLSQYAGKVVIVVNTASKCGFTPQLEGLEKLYRAHADEGLVVLGFPCNQFGHQEPGSADEISEFCQLNYGVSFPMFAKIDVNGADAHPLFTWLKAERGGLLGGAIKWNFTKFLINRQGEVINRYAPTTTPDALEADVVSALAQETARA